MKRTRNGLGPRVLLYSHDTYGLGHFRRSLSIATALAEHAPSVSVLCATGSPRSHSFPLPPNFDVVKLPSATKDGLGEYAARSLDLSFDRLVEMRSRLLLETVRTFRPNLVLVDHSPAGMAGELLPAIDAIHRDLPATRLWLGLRDVIDDPARVDEEWRRGRLMGLVDARYDRVFVYGSRDVFDLPREYAWPESVARRATFTGYVRNGGPKISRADVRRAYDAKRRPLVVVTVGGGGDGDRLLRSYADALRHGGRARFASLVLTGPLLSERKRGRIGSRLQRTPRTHVLEFHADVPACLRAANAVVSMGGYNSVVELMASGTPGLVAPRVAPRREQRVRAERLASRGCFEAFEDDAPEPAMLRERIEACLAGEVDVAPPPSLDGSEAMAGHLARALLPESEVPASAGETAGVVS